MSDAHPSTPTVEECLAEQRAKLMFLVSLIQNSEQDTLQHVLSHDEATEGLGFMLRDVGDALSTLIEALPPAIGQFAVGASIESLASELQGKRRAPVEH